MFISGTSKTGYYFYETNNFRYILNLKTKHDILLKIFLIIIKTVAS